MAISTRAWLIGGLMMATMAMTAACGSKAPTTAHPAPGPDAAPSPPATVDAPAAAADDAPVSSGECKTLLDHVVDIGMAEKKMKLPKEQWPTDEQIATIKDQMNAANNAECMKMPRAMYACAMQATTSVALSTCESGDDGAAQP